MDYSNVKNAHIVPRVYLANFAHEGKIGTHLKNEGDRYLVLPITNVGTRRRAYRRERPDGTPFDDVEWSLSEVEGNATPILRTFESNWPLPLESRVKLATLVGVQLVRGPRFKDEYERSVSEAIVEYSQMHQLDTEAEEKAQRIMGGSSYRLIDMLRIAPTLAQILASMHWTLVRFRSAVVATSDHPVVLWPGGGSRKPEFTPLLPNGLLGCIEVRLPLSSTTAVLMTWSDKEDNQDAIVEGRRDHAMNLNAFTIQSADTQWFHLPGRRPPAGSGKLLPLSSQLIDGYGPETAAASKRRARTLKEAEAAKGRELGDQDIQVVTVSRSEPE